MLRWVKKVLLGLAVTFGWGDRAVDACRATSAETAKLLQVMHARPMTSRERSTKSMWLSKPSASHFHSTLS